MMEKYTFKLTPAYCLYNGVAVIEQQGTKIRFLIEDIENQVLRERLKNAFLQFLDYCTGQKDCPEIFRRLPQIDFEKGDRKSLRKIVSGLYQAQGAQTEESGDLAETENEEKEAAAIILLDKILEEGRAKNATDIHIEKNTVRFRICGRLENQMQLIPERAAELIQRIKLLSGINVIEKRKSQDGHFVYGKNNPVFIRVSTMAVIGNAFETCESVVMRLLDTKRIPLQLENLGFNSLQLDKLDFLCGLKNGLLLISGATGAGKSTTAASMLLEILKRKSGVKIISLEDPPEYIIPGISQVQLDSREEDSFDNALRHVFRQDPDVIMIGEIRDKKTADTAIRAALTGHLVIGTIHAMGAGGSFLRMKNLGSDEKVLASVLKGVISQELEYQNIKGRSQIQLFGDVAIPSYDFCVKACLGLGEIELDELFNHFENSKDLLEKNIREMKTRILPVLKSKRREGEAEYV